jgi:hypothetical protein
MKEGFQGQQEFFMSLSSLCEALANANTAYGTEQFAIARVRDKDSEDNMLWVLSYPLQAEERAA